MDIKQARKNVIEQQIRPWGGLNVRANQALSDIPRENFVPEEYLSLVFADIEVPLVGGAKMFSPKIEGRILDSLDIQSCLLYTSPSPRDRTRSRMPSSA